MLLLDAAHDHAQVLRFNDDGNSDGFVDAGSGYDVTMALRNVFTLAPGESAVYRTETIFGSGAPGEADIPEPSTLGLLGGLTLLGLTRRHGRRGRRGRH